MDENKIENAVEHFRQLVTTQLARVEKMTEDIGWLDFSTRKPIVIGIVAGDGIGPIICTHARNILEFLLADEIEDGEVVLKDIEGLTIERRAAVLKAIPDDVLAELKNCDVLLKGPTTTPRKGDQWPNIESANVALRRELDLFANVRPVKVPEQGIDWVFFRENTEGAYILGSQGISVNDDLAIDFTVTTAQGSKRIIELAFEYAAKHNINKITVVTKANVIKTTDGKFLAMAEAVAKQYPSVVMDDWYIDIMAAKLIDPTRRTQFRIFVLPNLYGDIITDEAAQIQGGVGTAGSANLGKRYAMFEAIHGSAPRMVREGRAKYADPQSMLRATAMLLNHIGYRDKASRLEKALDMCLLFEKKYVTSGRDDGATGEQVTQYLKSTLINPELENLWNRSMDALLD